MITKILFKLIKHLMKKRKCDLLVDIDYMERWYIIPRNRYFNIYAHYFIGSDANVPHDHPWYSFGWILKGEYIEHTVYGSETKKEGSKTFRTPNAFHWIEIDKPVYTLFITGPRIKNWGFLCGTKWIEHKKYIQKRGSNRLANGCGE